MGLADYLVVTQASEAYLDQQQLLDHRSERGAYIEWLLTFGNAQKRQRATHPER